MVSAMCPKLRCSSQHYLLPFPLLFQHINFLSSLLLLLVASANAGTLRQSRDVSHLPLEYLPPVVLPPLPSRDYLPPVEQHAASLPHVLQPPRDYLPPVEELKLNNEYLPPLPLEGEHEHEEEETTTTTNEASTTTTTTEEPITTTEAVPTTTEEPLPVETEAPVEVKTHEDIEEASGVLEADGYHYRTPEIIPDLSPVALPAVEAYLPPLDDNAVPSEVEEEAVLVPVPAPHSDESSALLDDGYHYRAIRRLRF